MPEAAEKAPEPIDTEQHKHDLYAKTMLVAVWEVAAALNLLMTETFFNVFWEGGEQKEPGKLGDFFLPLLTGKTIAGRAPKKTILNRERFLGVCGPAARDKAEKKARESSGRMAVNGSDYEIIPDRDFEGLIREEFEKSYTDAKRVRSYFDSMDLQACCKINIHYSFEGSRDIYKKLKGAGLLGETSEKNWSELCMAANAARNTYAGHNNPNTINELRVKGGPKFELKSWLQAAGLLYSGKYNAHAYGQLRSAWDKAIGLHESIRKSKVFLFRDLLRELQDRGLDELSEPDLHIVAEQQNIVCDDSCALYSGTVGELAWLLEQGVRAGARIPLKDLEEYFGDDIKAVEDIEAYMKGLGVPVHNGTVLGRSKEEVMTLLSDRKKQAALEQAPPDGQTEEEEAAAGTRKHLPMLRELAEYRGGPLSQPQLSELLMTHQLVLDASVLLSEAGRTFLSKVLIGILVRLRGRGQEVFLMMDATTRYHIFDECERCKEAERIYRSTGWTPGREPERQEQDRQIRALGPAKAAYYFAQDVLRAQGLLRYIGLPDPSREGREMLRMLLEENPSRRFCVLTCGAAPLAGDVGRERFPLCAVARVRSGYYTAQGKQAGPGCLIFPQYLPLAQGGVPVDYDESLRETLRLPGEAYPAAAFTGGEPPKDEAQEVLS